MTNTALWGTSAVPVIIALVQILKYAGLPASAAPITALLLGVAAGILSVSLSATSWPGGSPTQWAEALLLGGSWGLAAAGLYEGARTAVKLAQADPNPYSPPSGPGHAPIPLPPKPS